MTYTVTLAENFVKELDQMVAETKGMDATAILVSIAEGYLSPRVEARITADAQKRLAAFDAAPTSKTKAEIIAVLAPIVTK